MKIVLRVESKGLVRAGVQCSVCEKFTAEEVEIPRVIQFALKGVASGTRIEHEIPGRFICGNCGTDEDA